MLILHKHYEHLAKSALEAFTEWEEHGRPLSDKQKKWLYGVAERLGLQVAPSENLFSSLSPKERARQREAAKKVKLPWE